MIRPAVAAIAVALLLAACSSRADKTATAASNVETPGQTYYPIAARTAVPALSGSTLAGGRASLAGLVGADVGVVNVWASWCTECRAESRGLGALSAEFGAQGVRFVGIDEQDVAGKARAFVAATDIRYPQLVDAQGTLLRKLTMLPSDGIPSTIVIDRQGRIAGRVIGATNEPRLRQLIERVSAEH